MRKLLLMPVPVVKLALHGEVEDLLRAVADGFEGAKVSDDRWSGMTHGESELVSQMVLKGMRK